jgi:glycerophosphoryl diester phosphodiesterase
VRAGAKLGPALRSGFPTTLPPPEDHHTSPEVIAHRGLTRRYRENTLLAFLDAVHAGADGIELDVHATADRVIVVHHDPAVRSEAAGGAATQIAALTFDELRQLQTGDERIPTLPEVLDVIADPVKVYVEIKALHIEALVCEILRACRERCAVHSFDHRSIARAHVLDPAITRGVLMTSYLVDPLVPLRDTPARDLWQQWELVDRQLIDGVHALGGRVIAWTVNDAESIHRLIDWGVDGVCTDRCDDIAHLLRP